MRGHVAFTPSEFYARFPHILLFVYISLALWYTVLFVRLSVLVLSQSHYNHSFTLLDFRLAGCSPSTLSLLFFSFLFSDYFITLYITFSSTPALRICIRGYTGASAMRCMYVSRS